MGLGRKLKRKLQCMTCDKVAMNCKILHWKRCFIKANKALCGENKK